jgi:hypothetical protein
MNDNPIEKALDEYMLGKTELRDIIEEKVAEMTGKESVAVRIATFVAVPLTPAEIVHWLRRLG